MRTYLPAPVALAALAIAVPGQGEVRCEAVPYRDGEVALQGYLAWDASVDGRRPGVLVVHEYWGLNDYARQRAEQLAEMGYVALAADYYGGGRVAKERSEASRLAGGVRGTPAMRTRGQAALAVLASHPAVDPTRLAVIGFCFGGTAALQLSYTGAALCGVVSFHGGLTPPEAEDIPRMKAAYLILHGADDPSVKPEQIQGLTDSFRQAGVDWQFISYGGAVHAFSNPEAGGDKSRGAAYDEKAARRSWQAMQAFFAEVFR